MDPEDWARTEQRTPAFDIFDLYERFLVFKDRLAKRFRKPKKADEGESRAESNCKPGDEMTQELTDAWNLFTRVSL